MTHQSHTIDLYGFPHAILADVLNPYPVSSHSTGNLVEGAIKRGVAPAAPEMVQAVRHMSLGEQNYLLACYVAWMDEAQFTAALESTALPAELCLASYTGKVAGNDEATPECDYETFSYSPRSLRKKVLEMRIAGLATQEQNYKDELARLSVPRIAVPV